MRRLSFHTAMGARTIRDGFVMAKGPGVGHVWNDLLSVK